MRVLYGETWYAATIERIVKTGLRVRYKSDNSYELIENEDVAERMRLFVCVKGGKGCRIAVKQNA